MTFPDRLARRPGGGSAALGPLGRAAVVVVGALTALPALVDLYDVVQLTGADRHAARFAVAAAVLLPMAWFGIGVLLHVGSVQVHLRYALAGAFVVFAAVMLRTGR